MPRFVLPVLMVCCVLWGIAPVQAGTPYPPARVSYHHLVLTLSLQTESSTVVARARLTNGGTRAWRYEIGCVPPVLQIQAYDSLGNHVYGWQPPGPQEQTCFALGNQDLLPGASIKAHARFALTVPVRVRAEVMRGPERTPQVLFQTPAIKVRP